MNNVAQTTTDPVTGWILPLLGVTLGIVIICVILWLVYKYLIKGKITRAADWIMLQVSVPRETKRPDDPNNKADDFRQIISITDQLFSSLLGATDSAPKDWLNKPKMSFEIVANKGEIFFFIGVPRYLVGYIEKQVQSYFPYAQLEQSDNFKILQEEGKKVAFTSLGLVKKFVYPVRTYKLFENDPINTITNAVSKLKSTESAIIQIMARPIGGGWRLACSRAATSIRNGKQVYENTFQAIFYGLFDFMSSSISGKSDKNNDAYNNKSHLLTPQQEELMKAFNEKASKSGFKTQIRIVTVSDTEDEANVNLNNIVGAFSQYKAPHYNGFKKKTTIKNANKFLSDFILREFMMFKKEYILNTEELAGLWHLPNKFIETPNIHWLMARTLPPPSNLSTEGTIIGKSVYRGDEKMVKIKPNDRQRHIFMIGKTGTGKTTTFLNMVEQDIKAGHGCCFIDPLGDAIENILEIIPKERQEDVVLFDPSDADRPMGLNLLEWKRSEDKDFLIAEWLEIFYKLFDPNRTGMVGPQFEHWGRNAALTVMAQPGGGSLIEIPRLFTDDAYRDKLISYVKDPVVMAFWQQQMAKTADFHKSEMFNYFISKFGRFMTNDLMRNIIGQAHSAFDFRKIMDDGKILLVNLSKGKIGEMNSYLLGMILVSKIQVAAFSRADIPESERKDFYLYIDEFQNFTTDTFKTILSEARKYHLNLNITNQYIAQLTEPIRDAVIGNAGTLIIYRIGAADAEFMSKEFPGITEHDITNLNFGSMYVKLLIDGTPSKPFSMQGIKSDTPPNKELATHIRQLSRLKYGRVKKEVEEEILERTMSKPDEGGLVESGPPREA